MSNAQEVFDTIPEETIIEVPVDSAPSPESSLENVVQADAVMETPVELITPPVVSLPVDEVPIDTTLDDKRLEIMAFQSLSFESTGEYTQVKDARVVEGDVIGFEASMVGVVEPTEEIHVYDAPCGQGWQLIVYDQERGYVQSSTTKEMEYGTYTITRSYGYGCEHDDRTYNW